MQGMLNRGLFDTMPLWPVVMWPIVFTSVLYALFSFNAILQKQGVTYETIYKGFGQSFLIFYPLAIVFDTITHLYLLYVIGWRYLTILPAVGIGQLMAKFIFGFMPYAQYIMPVAYIIVAISFLTLIGVLNVTDMIDYNEKIYKFLVGM